MPKAETAAPKGLNSALRQSGAKADQRPRQIHDQIGKQDRGGGLVERMNDTHRDRHQCQRHDIGHAEQRAVGIGRPDARFARLGNQLVPFPSVQNNERYAARHGGQQPPALRLGIPVY